MAVWKRRNTDGDLLATRDSLCARKTGDIQLGVWLALVLHPVDELHQFAGAFQVAEKVDPLLCSLRRIAAYGEKAGETNVEEFADHTRRILVRPTDTGQVGHRLDVGGKQVAQHAQRRLTRRTARAVRD